MRKQLEGVNTSQLKDVDKSFITDILNAYEDIRKLTGFKEQEAKET